MVKNCFSGTDVVILGSKATAAVSGSKGLQNTVDAFSLANNAYGFMSASQELASLNSRMYVSTYPYGYQSSELRNQISYYENQQAKHLIMGVLDVVSLIWRQCSK